MFDEMDALRASPDLQRLLGHYAHGGAGDREVWHPRLMAMAGVVPAGLVALHGTLIGFGWIEQNTGFTTGSRSGVLAACYRITLQGQRACHRAALPPDEDQLMAEAA